MIRNDSEYQEALRRLEDGKKSLAEQRAKLEAEGLAPEHIAYAIAPSESFALQVREEVTEYERTRRGDLGEVVNLHGFGRMLIAARIAADVTQRGLAERLEVHESQVSRDERTEYHGVTINRAARILDVLGLTLRASFEPLAAIPRPKKMPPAGPRPKRASRRASTRSWSGGSAIPGPCRRSRRSWVIQPTGRSSRWGRPRSP